MIYEYSSLILNLIKKYIITFLMIITRKGSFIPRVSFGSAGAVIKLVLTLVPIISKTLD